MIDINNDDLEWNIDPEWVTYVTETLDKVIRAIAAKYTTDAGLQEDCAQEARVVLLHIFPENDIDAYTMWKDGDISEKRYKNMVNSYCRTVVRNTVISKLMNYNSGNWYVSRTRVKMNSDSGKYEKVTYPSKFESLEQLMSEGGGGMQVTDSGEITWERVKTTTPDELLNQED